MLLLVSRVSLSIVPRGTLYPGSTSTKGAGKKSLEESAWSMGGYSDAPFGNARKGGKLHKPKKHKGGDHGDFHLGS
ncbi:hypothetical protein PtA15_11A85 [Puccinia triticina]|uniref:Srp40 C-terminal domain-containing protein n=1 Tax=Puccinia triticina TaxID=208348 RepID=A0ABY7CYH3_9BASI|nr:uncharacterized protein PtA15_11A85 [Puccinia triticina]WAQ89398.1 hypothetical protein PtA15_11A85 [Puccinia triticina]WAR59451.1 hypothetical protein PtB15_11B91 [Puccinia triticina]